MKCGLLSSGYSRFSQLFPPRSSHPRAQLTACEEFEDDEGGIIGLLFICF